MTAPLKPDDESPSTLRFPTPATATAKRARPAPPSPADDDVPQGATEPAPTVSAGLALLRKRLLAEQAALEALADRVYDLMVEREAASIEVKRAGRKAPKELRDRLWAAEKESLKNSGRMVLAEARIKVTLADIARAEEGGRPGRDS